MKKKKANEPALDPNGMPLMAPPKRRGKSRFLSTLLLVLALLLGAAAVVANTVRIPGLTHAADDPAPGGTTPPASTPDPKETDLNQRAEEITKQEAELADREKRLKEQEKQVADMLQQLMVGQSEQGAIRRIAQMYAAMPPYKAAPLLEGLDTEVAVAVLQILAEDEAAAIVAYMDPSRGSSLLSELIKSANPPVTVGGGAGQ